MGDPAVEVTQLVVRYGRGQRTRQAVDGLSLSVRRGSITAVLGPNGAGKTSTLETCEGFRRPTDGSVRVLGLDPITDRRALMPRIGVLLQHGGAWPGVRPLEMLRHVARLHAHPLQVEPLAQRFGLVSCARTPYRRLSGGEKQRLGLAMAVIGRPEVVFVDEPTTGLDPQARRTTWDLLDELRADGVTVVLTTHYIDEAERLADQVYVIDHGRVVTSGTPTELTSTVDGDVLRVRSPSGLDPESLQRALPEGYRVRRDDPGEYLIHGDIHPALLATVTTWCADMDVLPDSLSVERPTLEDVFLRLTGRELRP